MSNWDSRYTGQVQLLVEILPTLAEEKRFALKGGTAINLFEQDLPRLSVDIDLTWLPVGDFASDARDISDALEAIGEQLRIYARDLLARQQQFARCVCGYRSPKICIDCEDLAVDEDQVLTACD